MKIIQCLIAALLILWLSHGVTADDVQPLPQTLTDNVQSCYREGFKNADSFIAQLEKRRPLTANQRQKARQNYQTWTNTFTCLDFDYTVDGLTVRGFYLAPKQIEPTQKLPVVIYNRGGNADSGAIPPHYRLHTFSLLLEKGFIVVGSQYRGARLGKEPHPDRLTDEFGGKDVTDVLALLPIIDQLPHANSHKIGIWGTSRGAMMAFLAAKQTDRFSALISHASPSDITAELAFRPKMEVVFKTWIPNYDKNKAAELRKRSPLFWAEQLPNDLPVLLLHGARDQRVSTFSSIRMAEKLQTLNHPYRLVIYEDGGHGLREHEKEVRRAIVSWFEKYL